MMGRTVTSLTVACAFALVSTTSAAGEPVTRLLGEIVVCDSSATEGHPVAVEWYVTEPDGDPPPDPTSTAASFPLTLDQVGTWSVELVARYAHQAPGGGSYQSSDTTEISVKSVVAEIGLSSTEIFVDEPLYLDGYDSRWAAGVTPVVKWKVDRVLFDPCNGEPPPTTPADIECTIPANTLDPGPHDATLVLRDPGSGTFDHELGEFTVNELVPLSVDFSWEPFNPDPGETVALEVMVEPPGAEHELLTATWTWSDGSPVDVVDCQSPWGCMVWSHQFADEGWYDVTLEVLSDTESAEAAHTIEVGDPPLPPTANFIAFPTDPLLLHEVSFVFTGTCEAPCSFLWEFGDGATATVQNPTHAYHLPDLHTARLTLTNDGGSDDAEQPIDVIPCWFPGDPQQNGICHGGPVELTAVSGTAHLWSTGATTRTIIVGPPGPYWVDVDSGGQCWGHAPWTVTLTNCGDPGGDANLDGATDAADLPALVRELTDGDGTAVVTAGGGDLTAPGGDVTGNGLLTVDDLLAVVGIIYSGR
jgi:PKD repeat protein